MVMPEGRKEFFVASLQKLVRSIRGPLRLRSSWPMNPSAVSNAFDGLSIDG